MEIRKTYIDLAAGVMILWLLYYHALYPMFGNMTLDNVPWLFFFMPWFFYKSGYFFIPREPREECVKDAKKLLVQFAIWSAVGYVCMVVHALVIRHGITLRQLCYVPVRSLLLFGAIPINNALWFLLTLFIVRQVANYWVTKIHPLMMSLIGMIIAIGLYCISNKFVPHWFTASAWGLFFFGIGYWLKEKETNKWLFVISAFIVSPAIFFTEIPGVYQRGGTMTLWENICWYPVCACACVVFNNVCRYIDGVRTDFLMSKLLGYLLQFFKWVGRNAMIIYVLHYPLFHMTYEWISVYNDCWYSQWQGLVVMTVIYVIVIIPVTIGLNHIKMHDKK